MKKLSEMLKANMETSETGSDDMDPTERYYKSMCELHNKREGYLHLEDGYHCPICKNRGFIHVAEKTEFGYWTEINQFCECQKMRKTIRQMKKSGLESIISKYTMQAYKTVEPWQKQIHDKANRFVEQRLHNTMSDDWFYIGGVSGSGKTHICTAICRELLLQGLSVRYMLWRDEAVKLKANLTNYAEYDSMMGELKNVDVLYIDDLFKSGYADAGKQQPTPADINLAFELLNYRYNNPKLITILSSECTTSDLLKIDVAIGGRISERARAYTINLTGDKNYRTKEVAV